MCIRLLHIYGTKTAWKMTTDIVGLLIKRGFLATYYQHNLPALFMCFNFLFCSDFKAIIMMTPKSIQSRAHIAATIMGHKSEEYVIYENKITQSTYCIQQWRHPSVTIECFESKTLKQKKQKEASNFHWNSLKKSHYRDHTFYRPDTNKLSC